MTPKYFPINQHIEDEIKKIKRSINLSMNGVCAEEMTAKGICYKQNFGVAWVRLREIAALYTPDYHLAERLWYMDIRETKLMAPLLVPVEEFTRERLEEWKSGIISMEIAEIISMTLLRKLPYIDEILSSWITDSDQWVKLAALHTAARCAKQLTPDRLLKLINSVSTADYDNLHLSRGITALIENSIVSHKELIPDVKKLLAELKDSPAVSAQIIYQSVSYAIDFHV